MGELNRSAKNTMLSNNLWFCHRDRPVEDNHIYGDRYLAIIPEDKCIISLSPFIIESKPKVRIQAISTWYEEVSENELRFSLITRRGSRWQKALYREEEDFLQWLEPRDGIVFNIFCSKLPWNLLSEEYLYELNRALDRARRIKKLNESTEAHPNKTQ